MIMRSKTTQKNPGWAGRILEALEDADRYECAIGFPKGVGLETPHYSQKRADGGTVAGPSIIDIAIWNNFGTATIPARPFMDYAAHAIAVGWKAMQDAFLTELNAGKGTAVEDSLDEAGLFATGEVVYAIDRTDSPQNAPITIKRKKSSHPLIDTGAMKAAATHHVRRTN